MPVGYLVTVGLLAVCTLFSLAPPRPPRTRPSNLSFWLGYLVNEVPLVAWVCLLTSTLLAFGQGDIDTPGAWAAVGVAALTSLGLAVVAWRGLQARSVVERALDDGWGRDGGSASARGWAPACAAAFPTPAACSRPSSCAAATWSA